RQNAAQVLERSNTRLAMLLEELDRLRGDDVAHLQVQHGVHHLDQVVGPEARVDGVARRGLHPSAGLEKKPHLPRGDRPSLGNPHKRWAISNTFPSGSLK